MANTAGGGSIVVGVAEREGAFTAEGMTDGHVASFPKEEDFRAAVNGLAEPFVEPRLDIHSHEGKQYLVISTPEFEYEPVICMKTKWGTLEAGALYVRSTRKPETTRIHNPTDMRALLRLVRRKLVAQVRAEMEPPYQSR